MSSRGFAIGHLARLPAVEGQEFVEGDWKPVRHELGITAFGVNAYVSPAAGRIVIEEHDEQGTGHEELYYVAEGRATFTVGEEEVDAPAGTFVFLRDPELTRRAVAGEAGTAVLAIGARPGEPFSVSDWERRYTG